jgi:hypothetical protein
VVARGDEARNMGDVGHQIGSHFIGDRSEGRKVDDPGIGGVAADDHLGLTFDRLVADQIKIEAFRFGADAILGDIEPFARDVDRGTVGQVTAVGEVHAEDRVAGGEQGQEYREVGLGSRVGLDVGMGRAEKFLDPIDGDLLDLIDEFTAAVVALVGQALSIFVGENRALGCHHRRGGEVFAGDQFEVVLLAIQLLADEGRNSGVALGQEFKVWVCHDRDRLYQILRGTRVSIIPCRPGGWDPWAKSLRVVDRQGVRTGDNPG